MWHAASTFTKDFLKAWLNKDSIPHWGLNCFYVNSRGQDVLSGFWSAILWVWDENWSWSERYRKGASWQKLSTWWGFYDRWCIFGSHRTVFFLILDASNSNLVSSDVKTTRGSSLKSVATFSHHGIDFMRHDVFLAHIELVFTDTWCIQIKLAIFRIQNIPRLTKLKSLSMGGQVWNL